MFVACGIWCLADVSSVSPSSEQTADILGAIHYVSTVTEQTVNKAIAVKIVEPGKF